MSGDAVTFFLPGEPELDRLALLDPDAGWRELQTGERAWILQTFLRLARRGHAVRLSGELPASGAVVFHAKHERALRRAFAALPHDAAPVLVGVRADNRQALAAEFEILQNAHWADDRRRFALPHWPQPGLVPRDPARGERLARVAYKGFAANLAPGFRGAEWVRSLAALGLEWQADAVEFRGPATDLAVGRWADFRDVDALLAVRPPAAGREHAKPATKLTNAWLAGVPALLGRESAFRALRRSELDYFEVDGVPAALAALRRLRDEPGLYRAMVDNGRRRAAEVDVAAVTAAWETLLFERLPALAAEPAAARRRRRPLALRRLARLLARWAARRPPR